jgi:hypothetical protein
MQRRNMLCGPESERATYLSAVSGGSYITGAYTLLERQRQRGSMRPMADVPPFDRPRPNDPGPPVTPEEHYLSDHTLYLVHGPGGAPGALWHLALGIILNLAILGLVINLFVRPVGWAAGRVYPVLRFSGEVRRVHTPAVFWWILLGLAVAALGVGL